MKILKTLFWVIVLIIVGTVGYGVINYLVFLNVVEEALPESEEKIPDLGIVENTNLDEDTE